MSSHNNWICRPDKMSDVNEFDRVAEPEQGDYAEWDDESVVADSPPTVMSNLEIAEAIAVNLKGEWTVNQPKYSTNSFTYDSNGVSFVILLPDKNRSDPRDMKCYIVGSTYVGGYIRIGETKTHVQVARDINRRVLSHLFGDHALMIQRKKEAQDRLVENL